jgi:hypothetical protein
MRTAAALMALAATLTTRGFAAAANMQTRAPSASIDLSERLPDVATTFCIDVLSRKVILPKEPDAEATLFARYGLTSGAPPAAMEAIGPDVTLVAGATMASGSARDGNFIVALGGRLGETCRIIVYKAINRLFYNFAFNNMQMPALAWRALPAQQQPAVAVKLSLFKRDAQRRPFLANLLAPHVGPISLLINVAAVPPTVMLPEGL